jgi:hypothetical protein
LYNPTDLAIDEVIVLFKGKVIFRQYIPKKHKQFGIKIYKLCDALGYTYDMSVYLGKQRLLATQQMSATHGTVVELVKRVRGLGHKLYMDSYFSSPALIDDLVGRKINCCGTVRNNRRGMPKDISSRAIKTKKGDITRVRGNKSVRCKDNRDVYVLTNMQDMVTEEVRRFAKKHEERPLKHDNVEVIQLLDSGELTRRLRRTKPFELVRSPTYNQGQ